MSIFRILHLSDIHIGNTYKPTQDIAYKIISDIEHNGLGKLKSVIVTGDVFDGQAGNNDKLINEAVAFFEIILDQINLNQPESILNKNDIVFIPGNHDLIRVDDEEEKWSKYKKFLVGFYGVIPDHYDQRNFSVIKRYDEEKIVFIGFNSCQIERKKVFDKKIMNIMKKNIDSDILLAHGFDKTKLMDILEKESKDEYDDFGNISMAQITNIERKVKGLDDYNVIALFHHHFYLFPEIAREFGDTSLIRNYSQVMHHLKYMNVKTVLHGHKHFDLERPFITDDYYNSTDSIIDVFAGGSVGTARKDRHTFSVIDFFEKKNDTKLVHNKFIYNDEALEPIARKQIPPQNTLTHHIKLLEILKTFNPEAHETYIKVKDSIFKIYNSCNEITNWVSEAITGFNDVYKFLNNDNKNILFLLYSIHYRTLNYKEFIEKETSYFESSSILLRNFFDKHIATSEFNMTTEEYHSLFAIKKLNELANECDTLLKKSTNKKTQNYLAFTMIGIFFSDLYLVLTEYADDFKESIKYKVNIKIEENKFHENVPAPRIVIQSDADRRSAYIQLLCNDATAHKMAVLFIKEFDLMINKFEDYFKLVGLKLYYLHPKIDKNGMKDTLDNYNFEAYIPTLLPLLTGDNIYPSKVVFARELIQNSIDAIAVREAKESNDFNKNIIIEIINTDNNKRLFKIRDYGTGMDRYKIERYFTSIGRSFYSGDEYTDLNINYKPISNFGIGFLSSFMVCQEIDVKTKYFLDDSESLKLHIPNYDGCFFIERDESIEVGTELKLNIISELNDESIIQYIEKIMMDIKYEILIKFTKDNNTKDICIPAHRVREGNKNEKFKFFVPFTENDEVLKIDYEKEILNDEYIKKYEYGMLICKHSTEMKYKKNAILNAGILVEQSSIGSLFEKEFYNDFINQRYLSERENTLNDIILNFPASWIQIDVSREKITGFTDNVKKMKKDINVQIAESLYSQIIGLLNYCKNNKMNLSVNYLQEVIEYSLKFCSGKHGSSSLRQKLLELRYVLNVKFTIEGVILEIVHKNNNEDNFNFSYINEEAKIAHQKWTQKDNDFINEVAITSPQKILLENFESYDFRRFLLNLIEESSISISSELKKIKKIIKNRFGKIGFSNISNEEDIIKLLVLLGLVLKKPVKDTESNNNEENQLFYLIQFLIMRNMEISDVERGKNQIEVKFEELYKLI